MLAPEAIARMQEHVELVRKKALLHAQSAVIRGILLAADGETRCCQPAARQSPLFGCHPM